MRRFITHMLFTLTIGAAVCARAFPPQGISPDVMTQFKAPQWVQPRAETRATASKKTRKINNLGITRVLAYVYI